MNKYERLAQKLKDREKVIGTTMVMLRSTLLLEKMNRDDLDFVLLDAEHGIFDIHNSIEMFQVCRLMGLPVFLRAQDCHYHLIAKAIDMGADGIMIPRTESLEQLRTAVDALLFSPEGRKGMGGHGQLRSGESFSDFKKTRFLMPQIESPKGIELLPKMLEEYGEYISAVMVGPYDLSVMVGTPADIKSDIMIESIQKIFDISNSYNKSCGIFCDNEILAQKYRDMGCNVLWMATDKDFFIRGFNEEMDIVAKIK
jgi:2-keto-3-deoxy-L-rhamnonate aldolase RhmA